MGQLSLALPQYCRQFQAAGTYVFSPTAGAASVATKNSWSALSVVPVYAHPEVSTGNNTNEPLVAIGARFNQGWLQLNDPATNDPYIYDAGTYSVVMSYVRDSGLLTSDRSGNLTICFYRVTSGNVLVAELGRAQVAITITTTTQTTQVSITLGVRNFDAGDRLYFESHFEPTGTPTGTTTVTWNTGNASRLSAAPNYSVFREMVFDSAGVASDSFKSSSVGSGVFAGAGVADSDWKPAAINLMQFSADGSSNALVNAAVVIPGIFEAAGDSAAVGYIAAIFSGVFEAEGNSITNWIAVNIFNGIFSGEGSSDDSFISGSVAAGIFSGFGEASDSWQASKVLGAVFESDTGGGGDVTNIYYLPIFDD